MKVRLGVERILSTLPKGTPQSVRHRLEPELTSGTRDFHDSTEFCQVLGKTTDIEPSYCSFSLLPLRWPPRRL